jgi:hypothetical protein
MTLILRKTILWMNPFCWQRSKHCFHVCLYVRLMKSQQFPSSNCQREYGPCDLYCGIDPVQARCRARPATNSTLPRPFGHQKCSNPGNHYFSLVYFKSFGACQVRSFQASARGVEFIGTRQWRGKNWFRDTA